MAMAARLVLLVFLFWPFAGGIFSFCLSVLLIAPNTSQFSA
jgi:hypothetical protein